MHSVTEVPTPIFGLSCFAYFLLFVIVPTWKLLVDLGVGAIGDFCSDSRVCCQIFFFNSNKKQKPTKNCLALRRNNSSLSESNHAIPQAPHSLTDQKQSHLFKIENGLTVVYIFYFHNWSKESKIAS